MAICQYCNGFSALVGGRYNYHNYNVTLPGGTVGFQCPGVAKFPVTLSGDNVSKVCVFCGNTVNMDRKYERYLSHKYTTSGDFEADIICKGVMSFRIPELE